MIIVKEEKQECNKVTEGNSNLFINRDPCTKKRNANMLKKSHWVISVIFSFMIMTAIFLTSFQVALYGDFNVYKKEYEKYQVLSTLDMSMDDAMYVTHEMMDYLIGEDHILSAVTVVDGKEQEFFNDQDRFHMAEVKELFQGGLVIRRVAVIVASLCLFVLIVIKADIRYVLPRSYLFVFIVTIIALTILGSVAIFDFNNLFTLFHKIFFDNDMWMFDPDEDYMIRMLPEGIFADMTVRIAAIFLAFTVFMTFICIVIIKTDVKKQGS